jgi:DNA repair protein RecO (recombination protein O)
MSRSFTYHALVLRAKPSGESNRELWFLTAEEGIIRATLFGGPKSRLRAHAAPFNQGTLWVYHDPAKDFWKVSDFDVAAWRPGIRELWERAMAADAVAETVLAFQGGGGEWPAAAELAGGVLDALDGAAGGDCRRLGVYFLWRWAGLMGIRPDLSRCASCACEAPRDGVVWYSIQEGALLCRSCTERFERSAAAGGGNGGGLTLGPGGRLWLTAVGDLNVRDAGRYTLDAPSLAQAGALAQAVLAGTLGKRLATWDEI